MTWRDMCSHVIGREKIGDDDWRDDLCLLPAGHEGPHAGWWAWLGVPRDERDFSRMPDHMLALMEEST